MAAAHSEHGTLTGGSAHMGLAVEWTVCWVRERERKRKRESESESVCVCVCCVNEVLN